MITWVTAHKFRPLWTFFVSGSHPVASVQFCAQCVLWLTLAQRRKPRSSSWKGGGLSHVPPPPSSAAAASDASRRKQDGNSLVCLVTSVTNAGSAPRPLEMG